jgi:hypothetical protein
MKNVLYSIHFNKLLTRNFRKEDLLIAKPNKTIIMMQHVNLYTST